MTGKNRGTSKKDGLPRQLTPFIGRDRELQEISDRLADPGCWLLTLTGPGGIGKTRLALEAARRCEPFADGLYFVSLQAVETGEHLPIAISDALDIPPAAQEPASTHLLNYLADKNLLLILDNFEPLLPTGGAEFIAEIIRAAPGVKLLLTSREALNLQGEWLYPLEGLSLPPSGETDPAQLEGYGAVQLFLKQARRVRPDFSLAAEAEAVVRICHLVAGMPLGLELAAAWSRSLSCTAIAAEIERNLDFLTTSARNVPERHRSLRATIDHSWQHLSPEEQTVFRRLAVFRGGFRRQAAEQVAQARLPLLSALVDKSLLHWEAAGRYQMHEMLRQYAAERLARSDDMAQVYDRHCLFYADFLHARGDKMLGHHSPDVLADISAELENIRAAWQWAGQQINIAALRKSAQTLDWFYYIRGRYLEGRAAFEQAHQALSHVTATDEIDQAQVEILMLLAWYDIRLGRLTEAESTLAECRRLYERLDIPPLPGSATDPDLALGIIASIRGDQVEVARLGERALQTSESPDHPQNRMLAYYLLARAAILRGDYPAARQHSQQVYDLTQELGDRWFMAYCLIEMGNVAVALGDDRAAQRHYHTGYTIRQEFDDPEGMAVALSHLGEVALRQENYEKAQQDYQQSLTLYRKINDQGGLTAAHTGLGNVAVGMGDVETARHHFQQALSLATEMTFVALGLTVLVGVGDLLVQLGHKERGLICLAVALHHPAAEPETKKRAQQILDRYRLTPAATPASLDAVIAEIQPLLAIPIAPIAAEAQNSPSAPPLPDSSALIEPLTERELEILHLIAEGLTNRQIAERLYVVVGTIKAHNNNIYGKLGVNSRTQAVARARGLGLL